MLDRQIEKLQSQSQLDLLIRHRINKNNKGPNQNRQINEI